MKIRFWGTRGSLPQARAEVLRYGGNTSCVEVRTDSGQLLILDCGSGGFGLGRHLAGLGDAIVGTLLFSHTHWDHIQGFPFFAPLFDPRNKWQIFGPKGLSGSLRETLSGQMQYDYFPITLDSFGAEITYQDLVEGVFRIDDVTIKTQYLDHPALTIGYRIEADGCVLVYACDHEPVSRQADPSLRVLNDQEARHIEFLANANLVVHDAQYTLEEYGQRVGWGHSTFDYAAAVARMAAAKRLCLTHHDPLRDDDELDQALSRIRGKARDDGYCGRIEAAKEGGWVEIEPALARKDSQSTPQRSAVQEGAVVSNQLLLGPARDEIRNLLRAAAHAENIELVDVPDLPAVIEMAEQGLAAAILVDLGRQATFGRAILAAQDDGLAPALNSLPIIAVADAAETPDFPEKRATGWMIWPFSKQYAQTATKAWSLRAELRWLPGRPPPQEEARLETLRRLNILDTKREERFDRLTRLAAALFDTPYALITMIDRQRQWIKSAQGTELRETPRETAFCTHTILHKNPFVVTDALEHPCFADNPIVTGPPHVRFYAGCALRPNGQNAVGSLCVLGTRPREIDDADKLLLKDLASLVEAELEAAEPDPTSF